MQKFKLFLLFFVITGMVSCLSKPNESSSRDDDLCNANFVIEQEVKGSLSFSDATALPEKFTLDLTACIQPQGLLETKLASVEWAVGRNKKKLEDTIRQGKDIDNTTTLKHHDTVIKRKADVNGCIHWTEEHDYAYNPQSRWVVLNRHIGGIVKEYAGTCTIPLAVNPWLQLPEFLHIQVADYRKGFDLDNDILEGRVEANGLAFLRRKKEEERKNKVDIILENLELHTGGSTPLFGRRILHGNIIEGQLKYIIKDIYGNPKSERNIIKTGDFTIEPHLLIEESNIKTVTVKNKDGQEVEKEIKEIEFIKLNQNNNEPIETEFPDETLKSKNFDWVIRHENYTPRSIPVYLKLNPIGNTAERINKFEGVYYLGPNYQDALAKNKHDLRLNATLAVKKYFELSDQSKNESIDSIALGYKHPNQCFEKTDDVLSCLSMDKGPIDENGELRDGFGPAGWTVAKMNLRFFQMKRENWLSREIITVAETKISDPANRGIDITQSDIIVQVTDLSSGITAAAEIINSDLNGNVSFNIPTKQNWYNRQRYFLKIIHFSSKSGELDIKKLVAINPWDYGFTHGFEVNHPKNIRTTCLTEEDKKAVSDLLEKDTSEVYLSDEVKEGMSELNLVHKIFCHNPSDYAIGESPTDIETEILANWTEIFNLFKSTLKDALRKRNLNPEEDFFAKFTSSKEEIKRPTAHIHLFRSINKYPTSLIDNSLTREIYYNVRFKLSPRVVRHDDIAIGQQNKGPLRDGVHIFQMAILKNDQGKYNGNEIMVQSPEDFSQHNLKANKAGTVSLFSCPMQKPECVQAEDFIMPPTNIPILIREGMMKTDIRIPIKREYLLFANSKNLLVFRLIPADPASITCKDEHTDCTMRNSEFIDSYEANFDWEKTLKSIRPACSLEDGHKCSPKYEMFFYTYKTPFIPSLWANWNITHELDINFDNLEAQYHLLQKNKDFNDQLTSISRQAEESLAEYAKDQERYNRGDKSIANHLKIDSHEDIIFELKKLNDKVSDTGRQYSIDPNISENMRKEILDQIQTNLGKIEGQLQEYQAAIEQNTKMTAEQKEAKLNRVAELLTELQAQAQDPSSAVAPSSPKELETKAEMKRAQKAHNLRPKIFDNDSDTGSDTPPPTLSSEICPGVTVAQRNILIQRGENDPCLEHTKAVDTRNLTDAHISQFASTNNLCTITTTPDELLPKHCGNFISSPHQGLVLQRSFLSHLNKHIETINTISEKVRNSPRYRASLSMHTLYNRQSEQEQEEPEISLTAMRDSFREHNHHSISIGNSKQFAFKLRDIPKLKELELNDLENIISMGINNHTINNLKVGSFLHSLCGFWFSEFLSNQSQYITTDLLLDGFKQVVKNTVYYKLRGVTRPHEEDSDEIMQSIRTELDELELLYNNRLREQNLQGQIDDLHKWADNRKDFGFNPRLPENLHNKFQTLSQTEIFNNEKPSWMTKTGLLLAWLNGEDNKETDNRFQLEHYLTEAIEAINISRTGSTTTTSIRRRSTDHHPVRKCIMNPSHFFGFEKKTIVGKLARTQYEGQGVQTTLTISEDFLMNTQRDQGGNQQTELKLDSNISLLAIPLLALGVAAITAGGGIVAAGILPMLGSLSTAKLAVAGTAAGTILGFSGLLGGVNYSYRTYEGTGKRRLFSLRVTEGVELLSETTPITMHLEDYHDCLIIRPRFSAFESETEIYEHIWKTDNHALKTIYTKLGILLCTKGKTPRKTITETYHYIYPKYPINGITMDPSSHRNKPFAISLRGRKAYKQFIHNLSCYATANKNQLAEKRECRDTRAKYEYLLRKNIEFAKNLKKGFDTPKMFHLTGDSPGVFSYYTGTDREVENETWSDDLLNYLSNVKWLDKEVENIVRDE